MNVQRITGARARARWGRVALVAVAAAALGTLAAPAESESGQGKRAAPSA